jgi:hypothetical protein
MVTVLTRTIGPSGRDYASFTLAEADVTNIGTSADLVANDEAIVFEADAASYSGNVTIVSGLVTDATRNVTYRAASGVTRGQWGAGAIVAGRIYIADDFTIIDGVTVQSSSNAILTPSAGVDGIAVKNAALESTGSDAVVCERAGSASYPAVFSNNIIKAGSGSRNFQIRCGTAGSAHYLLANNTTYDSGTQAFLVAYSSVGDISVELYNTMILNSRAWFANPSYSGTLTVTGSNNFGPASNPLPAAIQGSPYPITATTDTDPGAGDWAIYDATTGALVFDSDNDVLLGGVGPDSNSDVPTTDIVGTARVGTTCDPGAFEVTPKDVLPTGIPSGETFGTLSIDTTITVTAGRGIVSAEAFGTALIAGADLVVTGIASAEVFGRPALEAGTQFRLEFQRDSTVVDVMTHVDAPLTTLTGQDRPIPGMVHTINYYAQHLGWSSDQTAANDEPSPYGGDKITVIVPPPRGDGATP